MVNVSTGWREQRSRLAAQVAQSSSGKQVADGSHVVQVPLAARGGQDATTRTMACPVCKALYTPTLAHQQLVLAPHIVLESAFMSMCHFCFRCRRAACPDCWDAVHGVCGACVAEAKLPFRTQVKPLNNAMPHVPQEHQVVEKKQVAQVLVCIQHGKFYVKPLQVAQSSRDSFSPSASILPHTAPVTRTTQRDGGRAKAVPAGIALPILRRDGGRAEAVPTGVGQRGIRRERPVLRIAPEYPKHAAVREENKAEKRPRQAEHLVSSEYPGQPIGWIAEATGALEQWVTGALLVLLLTIITMIVLAEASPSANAQIMHVFQIDIRSEIAYLIQLIGQLRW